MKSLGFSLSKNLNERGLSQKVKAAIICEYLKELLQQDLTPAQLESLESVAYKMGTCIVKARSAALKGEIKLRQGSYIDAVNAKFGNKTIEKITFN